MRPRTAWIAAMLLGAGGAGAAPPPSSAAAAFAVFQALQGKWTIHASFHVIATEMTYDIGSKRSIVTEEFGKELSVFTIDHGTVLMTHYCNAGNQPRLRLKLPVSHGVYDFAMSDITGLDDPHAAHVREIMYRIRDARTIDLTITWAGVGDAPPETYTLTRQNS
jgi:hypothetical protein